MSRPSISQLWRRLAASRHRSLPDDPDRVLVGLCRDLTGTVSELQLMLSTDGRDTDEIPGFDELADREAALIRQIAALPARTLRGVVAKAQGALLRPEVNGYDGALALALSAAMDLVRLAAGPGRLSSGDLPTAEPPLSEALLLSSPATLKEQIMYKLSGANGRGPVHVRDLARGVIVGLLGELGAGSAVSGIALLVDRPDLPRVFPVGLVLVGLGAITLAVVCLRRISRP